MTFDEVFQRLSPQWYSQFNVMCAYLWYNHRDEYTWYVHDTHPSADVDVVSPVPKQLPRSLLPKEVFKPKPRIATHARYRSDMVFIGKWNKTAALVQQGACYSPPFPKTDPYCTKNHDPLTTYWPEMHQFEFADWNHKEQHDEILAMHVERHKRIRHCMFEPDLRFNFPQK